MASILDLLTAADAKHASVVAGHEEESAIVDEAAAVTSVLKTEIAGLVAAGTGATPAQLDQVAARIQAI